MTVDFTRGVISTVWKNLQDDRFHLMVNVIEKLLTLNYAEPPMEKLTMLKTMKSVFPLPYSKNVAAFSLKSLSFLPLRKN